MSDRSKCQMSGRQFPDDWHNFPNLKERRRDYYYTASCPMCPGGPNSDRIQIYPSGVRGARGAAKFSHAWCRACNMFRLIGTVPISFDSKNSMPVERRWYHDRPEIDPSIADQMHANLGSHREYFHSRGISDRQIDLHKLGWTSKYGGRYTIPCYAGYPDLLDSQVLHGIQMRASDPADERRYISVTGSRNNVIFNSISTIGKRLKAVVIVEGPLDALAITSALEDDGVVGIAPFRGNNKFHAWEREWNACFKAATLDTVIVPDNNYAGLPDDNGDLIAFSRKEEIGKSRILRLPEGFKDTGQFIQHSLEQGAGRVRQELLNWLCIG